jgi:hypothetical protein
LFFREPLKEVGVDQKLKAFSVRVKANTSSGKQCAQALVHPAGKSGVEGLLTEKLY